MKETPNKTSLLEQLRAQSDALRQQDDSARPVADELREIDRRLLASFRWLDEALGHLEVIRPVVAHRFVIEPVLAIASPRYDRGFVTYRRHTYAGLELIEHVELFYRMAQDTPIRLPVPPGAASAIDERLRAAQLNRYQIEQDDRGLRRGFFMITPAVMASVRFVPDYGRQVVEATLRNVDRLESVALEFPPEAIGEPAMEDLVRLMLGEANTFLKRAPLVDVGGKRAARAADTSRPALSLSRYSVAAR
jgi:hypothetical protein